MTVIFQNVPFCYRAHIVDFHRATGADGTHPELFAWMKRYFSNYSEQTPVYIQHQGKFIVVLMELNLID